MAILIKKIFILRERYQDHISTGISLHKWGFEVNEKICYFDDSDHADRLILRNTRK